MNESTIKDSQITVVENSLVAHNANLAIESKVVTAARNA